jgi:hypothetical protein
MSGKRKPDQTKKKREAVRRLLSATNRLIAAAEQAKIAKRDLERLSSPEAAQ